jgi:hypothetical protein
MYSEIWNLAYDARARNVWPGPVTGIILSPGNGPAYVSGLGDALIKLDPKPQP